jgi:hypothetical protein
LGANFQIVWLFVIFVKFVVMVVMVALVGLVKYVILVFDIIRIWYLVATLGGPARGSLGSL